MESRPQNPEFGNNPGNFHPCSYCNMGERSNIGPVKQKLQT